MCVATPRCFAADLTIDTDTPLSEPHRLRESMREALVQAEMECVSIHTSLSTRGPRYGVSVSCFGLGELPPDLDVGAQCLRIYGSDRWRHSAHQPRQAP